MNFKVIYNVFSIPNGNINMGGEYSFLYEAKEEQLPYLASYINEYLQQYFNVSNYAILSIERV